MIIQLTVLQRSGDKTPADLILFSSTDLKVDNSSLTGESEPQERFGLPEGSKKRPVEAENMVCFLAICALYGTHVDRFPQGLQFYIDRKW